MTGVKILLIYPPVAKPCEPPAGIARLVGFLKQSGVVAVGLDANLEGILYLLHSPVQGDDAWTRRAARNLAVNIRTVKTAQGPAALDRYQRAVSDLGRVFDRSTLTMGARIGLANYQDHRLSPLRSRDLSMAARSPEKNPFFPYFSRKLTGLLANENFDVIGFSLNYLSQALTTFAMAGYIRQIAPKTRILLGGGLTTSWLRNSLGQEPFEKLFDHLVAGAGETALTEILGFNRKSQYVIPDYNDFDRPSYLAPGFILPYSASSGCYWSRCSFCPERAEKNPYQPIPVKTVIKDLHALSTETQPTLIHLLDNAISPQLMEAIMQDPPGPPWYGFARFTPHLADPDFCRALRQSGCRMLQLGLESGSQKVLDSLNKGIQLETAAAALKSLKSAGIGIYGYLLFGTAAETYKEARETLSFTAAHCEQIDFLNLAIFNLPAYAPEALQLNTKAFYEGDLSLYCSFQHPEGWHRQAVRRFLDKEFTRYPAIAQVLRRDPQIFTSNHAPFFLPGD